MKEKSVNVEIFTQVVFLASRVHDGTTGVLYGAGRRASLAFYREPSAPIRELRYYVPPRRACLRNSSTSPTKSTLRLPVGRVPRLFLFARSEYRRGQATLSHDGNRSRDLCRPLVPGRVERQGHRPAKARRHRDGKRDRAYQREQQWRCRTPLAPTGACRRPCKGRRVLRNSPTTDCRGLSFQAR